MRSWILHCTSILLTASLISCGDNEHKQEQQSPEKNETRTDELMTKRIPFRLVKQYPHNKTAYTEGLQYVDGFMYESTGHYGASFIYKYELETGKVLKEYKFDNKYFGEGMTIMGDKMYALTYRAQVGMVFDRHTFKKLGEFKINAREGWGLTNDSTHLIYGDGTSALYFLDPETLTEVKRMQVSDNYGPVNGINELEYINGYIYANQYERDYILKIDPSTGKVLAECDLRRIRAQAGIPRNEHREDQPEVMNGIAYDKEQNRIFITGKNWDKILEVKLDN